MTASIAADDATQRQVFAFLADPATHGGAKVERIDTHGAAVFLAGDHALKIKRAVCFSYLDYSTLERRKAACDEELAVNRRFAPLIYRRVVPITGTGDGTLAIDGDGVTVEWALEMARFDERHTIDHLAETGPLDPGLIAAIAEVIAASHATSPEAAAKPWVESISSIVAGNTRAYEAAGAFGADDIAALERLSRDALARVQPLLERRSEQGFVRHCHGDLHLANMVLIDDKPVLFDAIEFDPRIASVDVLYDLAFPLMDFVHYGRVEAANILLNRYMAATSPDNLDALAALPLLMSMRAAIRANVMLSRPARDANARTEIRRIAQSYFALALRLLPPTSPRLIAIGGLSGTGKSVLARSLAGLIAPLPGAVLLRSDVARKQHFKMKETDRLPHEAYRPEVTAEIYRGLAAQAERILAQGHSVIVDAVFARPDERRAIAAVASRRQVRFAGLFLAADLETRIARVSRRVADASDATPDIVKQQEDYQPGTIDWAIIDASGLPEQTLQRAKAALESEAGQACNT
jgi:hypothetical protein